MIVIRYCSTVLSKLKLAFTDLNGLMDLAEGCIQHVISDVIKNCGDELEFFGRTQDVWFRFLPCVVCRLTLIQSNTFYLRLITRCTRLPCMFLQLDRAALEKVSTEKFARVTYTDAIAELEAENRRSPKRFEYNNIEWGIDMQSEHERSVDAQSLCCTLHYCDFPPTFALGWLSFCAGISLKKCTKAQFLSRTILPLSSLSTCAATKAQLRNAKRLHVWTCSCRV